MFIPSTASREIITPQHHLTNARAWRLISRNALTLIWTFSVFGCSDIATDKASHVEKSDLGKADVFDVHVPDPQVDDSMYVDAHFSFETPLGVTLLEESRRWEESQITEADEYAQPRMCAHNVSRVLEMSGLPYYSDYLVPHMLDAVRVRGGQVRQLDTRDKRGFIKSLNETLEGRLPMGALVNGCLYRDCSGEGGDGHIAIIGHTDDQGVVYLYHNNWYRPDNEGGDRKPYMVSKRYYDQHDLRREWMATPWIRVYRDKETHRIVEVEGLLPAIDDLDPYTGFFLTVSFVPELLSQLGISTSEGLFCPDGMRADPELGACVTGDEESGDVYGQFPDAMIERCVERGLGRACTMLHTLESDRYSVSMYRWSRRVYESLRGESACPYGLTLDHDLGYCVQLADEEPLSADARLQSNDDERDMSAEVFGPFEIDLIERCFEWGGGDACASGRISRDLFKALLSAR